MLKIFNLIDIGECAGSGIPNIFRVWREEGWDEPKISESFDPARITLSLKTGKPAIKEKMKESIITFLTDYASARAQEVAEYIGLQPSRTRDYLKELTKEGIVVTEGANRNRIQAESIKRVPADRTQAIRRAGDILECVLEYLLERG